LNIPASDVTVSSWKRGKKLIMFMDIFGGVGNVMKLMCHMPLNIVLGCLLVLLLNHHVLLPLLNYKAIRNNIWNTKKAKTSHVL